MAQQRQQRRRGGGGVLRLLAVLVLPLLVSLCLARADAVAAPWASSSLGGAAPASFSEHGVATALPLEVENALARKEVAAREHSTSTRSTTEEEEDAGDVVPERVAMESTTLDYASAEANTRHDPRPPPHHAPSAAAGRMGRRPTK